MANETILVVEDDAEISEIISLYLLKNEFHVVTADSGPKAVHLAKICNPHLILLDIQLPGLNGFEVCRQIRGTTVAPIIFLSCREDEEDKINGLEIGGDDYITKPFRPNELVARIKTHLRRNERIFDEAAKKNNLAYGDLQLDLVNLILTLKGVEVPLSKREFELLSTLCRNPHKTFSLDDLYRNIWGTESLNDTRTVMVHIHNIRNKIEKNPSQPKFILTVRGAGYKFNPAGSIE